MTPQRISREHSAYPKLLGQHLGNEAPQSLAVLGEVGILSQRMLGLVCSVKCPGSVIIRTYDAIRELRDSGVTVVGGFHSPMEKECLSILLRGKLPVVVCPARGLERMRVPDAWQELIKASRLLLVSPFGKSARRASTETASYRNRVVAAIARGVFVAHASPGGKTEQAVGEFMHWGKWVCAPEDPENSRLSQMGVGVYSLAEVVRRLSLE